MVQPNMLLWLPEQHIQAADQMEFSCSVWLQLATLCMTELTWSTVEVWPAATADGCSLPSVGACLLCCSVQEYPLSRYLEALEAAQTQKKQYKVVLVPDKE